MKTKDVREWAQNRNWRRQMGITVIYCGVIGENISIVDIGRPDMVYYGPSK